MTDPQMPTSEDQSSDLPLPEEPQDASTSSGSDLLPGWIWDRLPWLGEFFANLESRSSFLVGLVVIAAAIGLSLYIGVPSGADQLSQETPIPRPSVSESVTPSRSVVPSQSPQSSNAYPISADEELRTILTRSSFVVPESVVFESVELSQLPQDFSTLILPDVSELKLFKGGDAYKLTYVFPGNTLKLSYATQLAFANPWKFRESSRANRSFFAIGESSAWQVRLTGKDSGDGQNLIVEVIAIKK